MSVYTWEKNTVGFFTLSLRWPNVGKYTKDRRLADGGLTLTKRLLAFLPVANTSWDVVDITVFCGKYLNNIPASTCPHGSNPVLMLGPCQIFLTHL